MNNNKPAGKSNLVTEGPLDKAFIVFHRMITTMQEAEPSVKVLLLAFDENDGVKAEGIMVSNLKTPAEAESLLKEGLNSVVFKRVLQNKIV